VACQQCQTYAEAGEAALNVVTRGEDVIVFLPDGGTVSMSAHEAEISARRLLDAADVARCRIPGVRE